MKAPLFCNLILWLVGGPDRPLPEKIAAEKARQAAADAGEAPEGQITAAGLVSGATALQSSVYDRLTGALNERRYVNT